ncbi:MAG: hypothetical protein ABI221_01055 [Candidatus Saccharimonadales bacterium]
MAHLAKKSTNQSASKQFMQWHDSRLGHMVLALVEIVLAYAVGSRALDTGSWWEYGFTLLLLIGFVKNLVGIFRKTPIK